MRSCRPVRPLVSLALLCLVPLACEQETITVAVERGDDYNQGELEEAVDAFVAAGRTAPAYQKLAGAIFTLRKGMDRATAEDAERKLVALALAPVQAAAKLPIDAQIDTLALTVWPALLADEIEADDLLRKRESRPRPTLPNAGETARAYLERLCGKELAADCKQVVPEYHGHVISALAIRRATERLRVAVADCVMCSADASWGDAIRGWEALDQQANATRFQIEREADPANWPTAGAAGEADPKLPEAEVNPTGELVIAGKAHGPKDRVAALRALRGSGETFALHLRPALTLAQVKGVLADARAAGAKKVAVIARGDRYPWARRIYWLSTDKTGVRPGLRETDSLQLLLHAVDHVGQPGTLARVD